VSLVIPELKRLYVSDSLDNLVFAIDETNPHHHEDLGGTKNLI
jgi:hypothetical protein